MSNSSSENNASRRWAKKTTETLNIGFRNSFHPRFSANQRKTDKVNYQLYTYHWTRLQIARNRSWTGLVISDADSFISYFYFVVDSGREDIYFIRNFCCVVWLSIFTSCAVVWRDRRAIQNTNNEFWKIELGATPQLQSA